MKTTFLQTNSNNNKMIIFTMRIILCWDFHSMHLFSRINICVAEMLNYEQMNIRVKNYYYCSCSMFTVHYSLCSRWAPIAAHTAVRRWARDSTCEMCRHLKKILLAILNLSWNHVLTLTQIANRSLHAYGYTCVIVWMKCANLNR